MSGRTPANNSRGHSGDDCACEHMILNHHPRRNNRAGINNHIDSKSTKFFDNQAIKTEDCLW